ncbi:FMN-binding [Moorella glycerini]|uniref:Electron transport protein YccM n=1 Tax=Neomoorella stamsii TaxID=1266720 RepID=A0A9X7J480_9FIRM|nr:MULTISPECIES: FMN-binding protein [Moorella]PRR74347.1 putative electron transport protein YccM [Moorella stamsii]CEP66754.1 FMN-binding [Moorella glycerini]
MKRYLAVFLLLLLLTSIFYFKIVTESNYEQLMQELAPEAAGFEHLTGTVYRAFKINDQGQKQVLGFISSARATGYAGPIEVLTFIDTTGRVKNLMVTSNVETPSFFARVMSADYLEKFKNKMANDFFEVGQDIDGVSRATYTSRGIAAAVQKSAHYIAASQLALHVPPNKKAILSLEDYSLLALLLMAIILHKFKMVKLRYVTLLGGLILIGLWQKSPVSLGNIATLLAGNIPSLEKIPFWFLLVVGIIVIILATGRNLYCYWLCPCGALMEIAGQLGKAGRLTHKPCPRRVQQLKNLRLMLAWGALVMAFWLANPSISSYEIFAPLFAQEGNAAQWLLLPFMLFVGIIIYRFWCRFFCPVGAILDYLVQLRRRWVNWLPKRLTRVEAKTPFSTPSS